MSIHKASIPITPVRDALRIRHAYGLAGHTHTHTCMHGHILKAGINLLQKMNVMETYCMSLMTHNQAHTQGSTLQMIENSSSWRGLVSVFLVQMLAGTMLCCMRFLQSFLLIQFWTRSHSCAHQSLKFDNRPNSCPLAGCKQFHILYEHTELKIIHLLT